MATITPTIVPTAMSSTTLNGLPISTPAVPVTLGASDTFTFQSGTHQVLILRNPTGGAISPVIDGDDGGIVQLEGYGRRNVVAGYPPFSIAAGAVKVLPLDTMSAALQGVITITSGAGLVAILLNP